VAIRDQLGPRAIVLVSCFASAACSTILGDEFEINDDAGTTEMVETGGAAGDVSMQIEAGPAQDSSAFADIEPLSDAKTSEAPVEPPHPDAAPPRDAPAPTGHLVINEVDYDQPGADNAEFVEIYNGTGVTVSLASLTLVLVNGATNQEYMSIPLAPAGDLPDGQYLVVCSRMVTVDVAALKLVGFGMNAIQNGAPDGVALVDSVQHKVLDALSYAGSITAATLTDVTGPVNLVEGTPTPVLDSATANGSLVRKPNGHDSDNAAADWAFSPTPTPGAANVYQ
jgi:hypothetical protein